MRLKLGIESFERDRGDQTTLPVINMFAEKSKTAPDGIVLQSRPGFSPLDFGGIAKMGTGAVDELFAKDGVLGVGAVLYGVADSRFYYGVFDQGAVPGGGKASIAGNEVGVMTCAGSALKLWNGTTLSAVTFPDGANVTKVITGVSRFIALRQDGGKFYWTPPLGVTFAELDFATAESATDRLVDAVFMDDTLVLGGTETIEFWPSTGDSNQPFQPMTGRVFNRGVKQTGCMVEFDSSFAWVGHDNVVYTNGPKPVPLSDAGLEEKIAATANCRLFTFRIEGSEFLALRVDAGTWVLNSRSGLWSEMQSFGLDNWAAQCWAAGNFGADQGGHLFVLNEDYSDYLGPLERRYRAGAQISGGGQIVNDLTLECNPGQTRYLNGQYADPQVEMRVSRDGGKTWGDWRSQSLGAMGEYRKQVQWRALGMASAPGFLAEFRVTDPVPHRVSGANVNEKWGGRR